MLNFNEESISKYRNSGYATSVASLQSEDGQQQQTMTHRRDTKDKDKEKETKKGKSGVVESMDVDDPKQLVEVTDPPLAASVFRLFFYCSKAWIEALSLSYDDIRAAVEANCHSIPVIRDEIIERRLQIGNIIKTFITRMILELFTVDECGTKVRQILTELDETFLLGDKVKRATGTSLSSSSNSESEKKRRIIQGGRSNFINADAVHASTLKTYTESMSTDDAFFRQCSSAKKRGRRPTAKRNQQPDRIDLIKSSHILSQKSVAPTTYNEEEDKFYTMANALHVILAASSSSSGVQSSVDFYPVFRKVLENFHHCIPRAENHGLYTARLDSAVRLLRPQQWPAMGLVCSLMNMERCFPLRQVNVPSDGGPYHCAYSGLQLVPGERVWHLRLLVCDGARHTKWYTDAKPPPVPMIAPEFTRSIRAYFIKCSIVGPRSLFYKQRDGGDGDGIHRVKSKFSTVMIPTHRLLADSTPPPPSKGAPQTTVNPTVPSTHLQSLNTLWILMNKLRYFITHEELDDCIYSEKQRDISYKMQLQQMIDLYERDSDTMDIMMAFRSYLFIGALVSNFGNVDVTQLLQSKEANQYIDMVFDTVLDFMDLMFPRKTAPMGLLTQQQQQHPTLVRYTFSLNEFAIKNDEKSKIPAVINPVVREQRTPLFATLLAKADERDAWQQQHPSDLNKRDRIERLEKMLCRHPFIYMALFHVIYERCALSVQHRATLKETRRYLKCMGLFINTGGPVL
jgi:hypothetical protein